MGLLEELRRRMRQTASYAGRTTAAGYHHYWRVKLMLDGISLANTVGAHQWYEWDNSEDRMLPAECLRRYARTLGFDDELILRIGRAIERSRKFQQIKRHIRNSVNPFVGTVRHPVSAEHLQTLINVAMDSFSEGWRFDGELQAVVGGIHSREAESVHVHVRPVRDSVVWRANIIICDVYDFINQLGPGPLRDLRDRYTRLLRYALYQQFYDEFRRDLYNAPNSRDAQNPISRPAVIAYYFHACEQIAIYRPIRWCTIVTILDSEESERRGFLAF